LLVSYAQAATLRRGAGDRGTLCGRSLVVVCWWRWFCGAEVASVAGMGATRDLQPDPMPTTEGVRDGPKIKVNEMGGVGCGIGKTDDPVGDVDRPAARADIAEAGMQVDVRHRRLHIQADPHRTDHLQLGGLGVAGEGKNVRSGLKAAIVGGAGSQTDGGACDGRGRVRRVIAKPARRAGRGWLDAEPAGRMQIPGGVTGRRGPAGLGRSNGGNR
jgi:hypothetical protein